MIWILMLFCGVLGWFGGWGMSRFALPLGFGDSPTSRSSHERETPRGGGAGILLAVVLSALWLSLPLLFWVPAIFLALVSFYDDRTSLSPGVRLIFQFLASTAVLPAVVPLESSPVFAASLGVLWIGFFMATANFFNFMDGINGMAGISGAVAFSLTAAFAFLSGEETRLPVFASCLAAACVGFLPLNFPRAKVFLGDVGSILLGFLFAVLVAILAQGPASFLVMAGFLLPFYCDAAITFLIRWRKGENLLLAHRQHLYQILVHKTGFRHWQVSVAYGVVQLLIGIVLIWTFLAGQDWFAAVFVPAFFIFFGALSLRVRQTPARLG